ncbi:hypothetical protein SKAU_G00191910 [Synaphobranchus kaupii]|uniref:Reverse transcriptase/retrotransposon-derived protein RNase H-like domain-containing protein n=1 Tax=Synaphobranchus kaupii TaxID=118154 RepID=A0A9Q1FDU0_SYNKA|nr:hypothetical protein SKAU_G00191910 [Synaphobranchus kaupii]
MVLGADLLVGWGVRRPMRRTLVRPMLFSITSLLEMLPQAANSIAFSLLVFFELRSLLRETLESGVIAKSASPTHPTTSDGDRGSGKENAAHYLNHGVSASASVLAFALPFRPYTDACLDRLGVVLVVLVQVQGGQESVSAYASRSLHPPERKDQKYSSFKPELLALKWAVTEKFRDYLWGSSLIARLQAHLGAFGLDQNLGLDCQITWAGRGGRRWEHLMPLLRSKRADICDDPDVMVIHLGGNSIGTYGNTRISLMRRMKADIREIDLLFPKTKLMFSDILPRWNRQGQTATTGYGLERTRRRLNGAMFGFLSDMGCLNRCTSLYFSSIAITTNQHITYSRENKRSVRWDLASWLEIEHSCCVKSGIAC